MPDLPDLIVLHELDNCATALRDLEPAVVVRLQGPVGMLPPLALLEPIRLGHKAALIEIAPGDLLIKHGEPFGRATAPIAPGAHVHVHNVLSLSREADLVALSGEPS